MWELAQRSSPVDNSWIVDRGTSILVFFTLAVLVFIPFVGPSLDQHRATEIHREESSVHRVETPREIVPQPAKLVVHPANTRFHGLDVPGVVILVDVPDGASRAVLYENLEEIARYETPGMHEIYVSHDAPGPYIYSVATFFEMPRNVTIVHSVEIYSETPVP